ncbi:MAG: LemA family protein [Bacillota bacterium]
MWIPLIAIGFIALVLIGIYNGLVRMKNQAESAWHQIDVQLKRRSDLIPNLVETVKGYAAHEKETFENITKARAMMAQAATVGEQSQAQNAITGALKSLFAVAENYPELKANQNFLQLQEELSGTENKISYSRQFYNDAVQRYNTGIQSFPANIFAGIMGFSPREYFEIEEAARAVPVVKF